MSTAASAPGSGAAEPRSPIRLLQATSFVSTLDRFAMPPMLVAIAHDLGVPLSSVVQAAGAYFLAYGLSQPVWGMVSDRIGRVRTMRLTLLLAGLCAIGSAMTASPATLGIARGLAGGFFGAAYPATLIYLGDTVPASVRQRDIARLMVGVATGTALASVGAGALAGMLSWRIAFVVTGIAAVVLSWVLRRLPEPVRHDRPTSLLEPIRQIGHSRVGRLVLLFAFVEGAVLLGALTLLPPAVEYAGASTALAGTVTGVYGISVYVSSRLVGHLSQTWHPSRLIGLGGGAAAVACSLLALSQSPAMAIGVALLLGLAWTSMHSSLQTWATEVLPSARATIVSFFAGSLFVGSALAAVLVAGLAESGRYSLVFALGAALAVPLGLAASAARQRWQRPPDGA